MNYRNQHLGVGAGPIGVVVVDVIGTMVSMVSDEVRDHVIVWIDSVGAEVKRRWHQVAAGK